MWGSQGGERNTANSDPGPEAESPNNLAGQTIRAAELATQSAWWSSEGVWTRGRDESADAGEKPAEDHRQGDCSRRVR